MNIRLIFRLLLSVFLLSACSLSRSEWISDEGEYTGLYSYSEVNTAFPGLYRTAADYIREGDFQQAESTYREIISREPDLADGYLGLATSLSMQQREREAIDAYQTALEIAPESIDALIGLGSAFSTLAMYEDAIQSYSTAVGLDADYPNAHWGLALALVETGRYPEAVEHLNAVINLAPGTSLAEHAEKLLAETLINIE